MAALPVFVHADPHPVTPPPRLVLVHGGRARRRAAVFRRRRVTVALVGVAIALLVATAGRAALTRADPGPPGGGPVPMVEPARSAVVVQPGDTLWSIARRLDRPGDVRATVDALASAHGTGPLVPGQQLAVPGL